METKINNNGFYGEFGGAFVPELLQHNLHELKSNYLEILQNKNFQNELNVLLTDYAGRPSPLYLTKGISELFKHKVYFKREDLNHTGAHKINNTIGQILLAKALGKKRIIAETGAGQHGVATATVCALMQMPCVIYMGEVDINRQAPNVARMKMLGAEVRPALSGSKTLKDATNEAIRDWINHPEDTFYIIGSVVGPHPYPDIVCRFQSIISKEIKSQLLNKEGSENPTRVIACIGGGSNAAGTFFHFIEEKNVQLIGVEAAGKGLESNEHAASLLKGKKGVIHGSLTYLLQDEFGQITEPYSISAGLDYPGIGPLHAHLHETKRAQFIAVSDEEALNAVKLCCEKEGIIPALESAHAIAALNKIKTDTNDITVICLSGRGDKDMSTYMNHFKLN